VPAFALTGRYSASIRTLLRGYGRDRRQYAGFLLYARGIKKNSACVFHGVPELLIWDCGTANLARPVNAALGALGVKTLPHLPGNPRAKGQAEAGNNIAETQFESRLRFEPVSGLKELNGAAERRRTAYNANLPGGQDTRLKPS